MKISNKLCPKVAKIDFAIVLIDFVGLNNVLIKDNWGYNPSIVKMKICSDNVLLYFSGISMTTRKITTQTRSYK